MIDVYTLLARGYAFDLDFPFLTTMEVMMVEMTIRASSKAEFSFNSTAHNSQLMQMFGSTFERIGRYYTFGKWGLASDSNHTSHRVFEGNISCHIDDERLVQELPEILALLPLLPNVVITLQKTGAKNEKDDGKIHGMTLVYGDDTKVVFEPMVRSFLSLERYSVTLKMGTLTPEAVVAAEGEAAGEKAEPDEKPEPVVVMINGVPASDAQVAFLNRDVRDAGLKDRSKNCLVNEQLRFMGAIFQEYKTDAEILRIPNFGRKSLAALKEVLAEVDMYIGQTVTGWVEPE